MPVSLYEMAWIFMIYAFLGWCVEVAYAALETKSFVNRGFLNGPVCPIYGCGVLVVIVVLTPLKHNFLLLFAGSFLLTSVIEFFTGFLLEKLFHNQWWDYSEENFNICGYVCLKFSILWGMGCTLVMDVIHPTIYKAIQVMPKIPGSVTLSMFCIVFVVDLGITVAIILKFNQKLKLLDEMGSKLKIVSNEIGENIYESVTVAVEKREEWKEAVDIKAAELKEDRVQLLREYHALMEHNSFGSRRLMKAFPRMKSSFYQETLLKLKNYRSEKKENKDKIV